MLSFNLSILNSHKNILQVDGHFEAEESRTNYYLSGQTEFPLRQILKEKLLTPHLSTVISMPNSGLDVMVDGNKISDFSRLYRLFLMVPAGLPCLKASLKASVARRGKEINDASIGEDSDVEVEKLGESSKKAESSSKGKGKVSPGIQPAINWVQGVLSLKDKFDTVWKDAFQSSREVESTLIEVSLQVVGEIPSSYHDQSFRLSQTLSTSTKSLLNIFHYLSMTT